MSDFENASEQMPAVELGHPLPGLVVDVSLLPEGTNYWDQVLPSPFGQLYYAPEQYRNGTIRWVTNHGEVRIIVQSGTGTVLEVDEDAQNKHSDSYSHVYEMGMAAYQDCKRQLREEYPDTKNVGSHRYWCKKYIGRVKSLVDNYRDNRLKLASSAVLISRITLHQVNARLSVGHFFVPN